MRTAKQSLKGIDFANIIDTEIVLATIGFGYTITSPLRTVTQERHILKRATVFDNGRDRLKALALV